MRIAIVGDVHGHLALMYAVLGRWQRESGRSIDLVLQLGDMGAFLPTSRLDSATKRHAERDPEELGFSEFAGDSPPPTLLDPRPPLVFIPGNHEDFEFLEECERRAPADDAVYPVSQDGRISALRSGRIWSYSSGDERLRIAGVSGVARRREKTSRHPRYHLSEEDALALASAGPGAFDILISHDGPEGAIESYRGTPSASPELRLVIEEARPAFAFFAHYGKTGEWTIGRTRVYALGGCGYVPRESWPLQQGGFVLLERTPAGVFVERLSPEWLGKSNRHNWRHWGRP